MSPLAYVEVMKGKTEEGRFDIRLRIVRNAQVEGIRATARAFRCSRNTVRQWLRRYDAEGAGALESQSRAPKRIPHKTSKAQERAIVRARRRIPSFGPARLKESLGLEASEGAIARILRERGLTRRPKKKGRKKRDLRAVKAAYRALTHAQVDVKYLTDIANYWPQMQARGLPRYQYSWRGPKTGAWSASTHWRACRTEAHSTSTGSTTPGRTATKAPELRGKSFAKTVQSSAPTPSISCPCFSKPFSSNISMPAFVSDRVRIYLQTPSTPSTALDRWTSVR